jgi:biopolymer transport protein ExbD
MERIPVALPVADRCKVPDEARDRQLITLLPRPDGSAVFYMNRQQMDESELAAEIARQAALDPNLRIYLRAGRTVRHKDVKAVMHACSKAGIADIIFGTYESGN